MRYEVNCRTAPLKIILLSPHQVAIRVTFLGVHANENPGLSGL
jgi:hypothetical protein